MKKINPLFCFFALGLIASAAVCVAEEEEFQADEGNADAIVEFHIPNGTGSRPWNTRAGVVNVKIGQTLRIVNDDSIPHRLHTFERPCPHQGPDSRPGEFYDCVIATTADPDIDLLYDHNVGASSRFYVRATR